MPKISVILPFFNAEATLEEAMVSIAQQTFGEFECILIDNNSTDGSRSIADKMARSDKRFVVITEPKQGVVFASNRGWRNSRGEYIARMDADDKALPDRLREQAEFLDERSDYGAVAGLAEYAGYPADTAGFARYVNWNNSVQSYKEILRNRFIDSPVINPTAMWRREVAERHGMYRFGDYPEDYELWLRWLSEGVKICKIPYVIHRWNDFSGRLTRNDPNYSDEAFYRIKSFYLGKWLESYNPFHPEVVVWGASRISRSRARLLESYGIRISAYIDIKNTRQLAKDVIHYRDLPKAGQMFILVYIRQWHAKEEIKQFLHLLNYSEGEDYLLMS